MTKHEETARGILPCHTPNVCGLIFDVHDYRCSNCVARPAVAAALAQVEAEKDEIIEKLNDGLRVLGKQTDAQIARLKAEVVRLWRPMECGHPNACYSYLGPADNNPAPDEKLPKPCLACRYGDAAEARGVRIGLERAREIAGHHKENGFTPSFGSANGDIMAGIIIKTLDAEIAKAEGKSPA